MTRAMLLAAALITALLLPGCASRTPSPSAAKPVDPACTRVDCAKIAEVNASAKRNGITVIWLHPPQKPPAVEPRGPMP